MAEAVAERVKRYVFDGTDQDLRRLLRISELSAEMARAAFRRAGLQEGWSAIGAEHPDLPAVARPVALQDPDRRGLPAPFVPRNPKTSPWSTLKLTPCRRSIPP